MADVKISALTADTSPTSDDLIVTVNDPSGTPANRKVTLANAITKAHGLSAGVVAVASGTMAASTAFSTRSVSIQVFDGASSTATGDGKAYFTIPTALNGMDLVAVHARVVTAGTTGTTDIQIANVTDSVDMLSTKLTIDSTETGSDTAATAAVINTATDDVASNDLLRIDVDAVSTTPAKGLIVTLEFRLP